MGTSRKAFLSASAGAAGLAVLPSLAPRAAEAAASTTVAPAAIRTAGAARRRERVYQLRRAAAEAYLNDALPANRDNGDEARYDDKRASFTKTLPHDDLGHVDPNAYRAFVRAIASSDSDAFEVLPRDSAGTARLNNPQATYSSELAGSDSYATALAPPPAFASARNAVDMGELYWASLALDVPFRAYESDPIVAAAVSDLRAFSAPLRDDGTALSAATIFRGEAPRDAAGPFVSQFLYADVPYGQTIIQQRYRAPVAGQRFIASLPEWLACQRGVAPASKLALQSDRRYLVTGRDLAEYAHTDFSYQPYLNAALILLSYGNDAFSPTNPYRKSKRQFGDITFGNKNVLTLVAQAALIGQKGAWYHKWQVHRRVRPEAFSGRVDHHVAGRRKYDLHGDLLRSDALARHRSAYGSALLAAAYPEGCPTHPSYPSAHAANAGACATILKAFFDESFVIPKPVQPTAAGDALEAYRGAELTAGGEIDKLASNVTVGRDFGAVHYRTDSIRGMLVGEQQAIGLLRDVSSTYNERFDGFVLTKLDGKRIRIKSGRVTTA